MYWILHRIACHPAKTALSWAARLQSGEVFLKEHFVLAVLYVQLRACSARVYGRAFLDFRKLFGMEHGSTLKKS